MKSAGPYASARRALLTVAAALALTLAGSDLRGDGQAGTATVSARSGGFSTLVQIVLE